MGTPYREMEETIAAEARLDDGMVAFGRWRRSPTPMHIDLSAPHDKSVTSFCKAPTPCPHEIATSVHGRGEGVGARDHES